jgi:hypothetical protein
MDGELFFAKETPAKMPRYMEDWHQKVQRYTMLIFAPAYFAKFHIMYSLHPKKSEPGFSIC